LLVPGQRTGTYRTAGGTLVVDEHGDSRISMEDFAVAALEEAEHRSHTGRLFTVGY
jgi:putative NADH-flavin reductase